MNTVWMNWERMTGVLCDKRMSLRVKGKIFKTAVRPAKIYGAKTGPIKKEKRLEETNMKILR